MDAPKPTQQQLDRAEAAGDIPKPCAQSAHYTGLQQTLTPRRSARGVGVAIAVGLLGWGSPAVAALDRPPPPATGWAHSLPEVPPDFGSPRLMEQLHQYRRYLAEGGPADILVVGSSRSLSGVDPAVLATALAAGGRPGLRVYNLSVNGATAQVVRWLLVDLLPEEAWPRLLLWADGSRAFNSARRDATFETIAASEGFRQLRQGRLRVENRVPDRPPVPATAEALGLAGWGRAAGCVVEGARSLTDWWLDRSYRHLTARYPCRDRLVLPARSPQRPHSVVRPSPPVLANGFVLDQRRFDPDRYYRQYPKISGSYDDNYVPFRLEGVQDRAARHLLQVARDRRVPVILVNLPLSDEYLDAARLAHERQFQAYLARLIQEGSLVRDWLLRWPTRHDYFADPSHLNPAGAAAISHALAQELGLPWPRINP